MSNRVSPKAVASSSQHGAAQPPATAREHLSDHEAEEPFASQKGSHAGGGRKKKEDHGASKQSPMRTRPPASGHPRRGSPKRTVHSGLRKNFENGEKKRGVGERGGGRKSGFGAGRGNAGGPAPSEELAKQREDTGGEYARTEDSCEPESPRRGTTDSARRAAAPDEVVVEKKVLDGGPPQEAAPIPDFVDKNSPPRIGASSRGEQSGPPEEINDLGAASSNTSWRSRTILGIVLCLLSTAGGLRIAWLQGHSMAKVATDEMDESSNPAARGVSSSGSSVPSGSSGPAIEAVHAALSALERMGRMTADWVETGLFGAGGKQDKTSSGVAPRPAKLTNLNPK